MRKATESLRSSGFDRPGALYTEGVRLGQSYGSYLRAFRAQRNAKKTLRPLLHKDWCLEVRFLYHRRRVETRTIIAKKDLANELRGKGVACFGLGFVPSFALLRKFYEGRLGRSPVKRRGDVVFRRGGCYVPPEVRTSSVDPEAVARYQRRVYVGRLEEAFWGSYPVGFVASFATMGRRLCERVCLSCGGHPLDGMFCCFRYIDRQLALLSKGAQELHYLARVDAMSARRFLSSLVSEARRLHLQRHRLIWHYSLMCLPYAGRFNRVFALTQDLARLGMAAAGEDLFGKVSKARVVKEVADLTVPSEFEITELLFGFNYHHGSYLGCRGWPVLDDRLMGAIATMGVILGIKPEEAFELWCSKRFNAVQKRCIVRDLELGGRFPPSWKIVDGWNIPYHMWFCGSDAAVTFLCWLGYDLTDTRLWDYVLYFDMDILPEMGDPGHYGMKAVTVPPVCDEFRVWKFGDRRCRACEVKMPLHHNWHWCAAFSRVLYHDHGKWVAVPPAGFVAAN